MEDFEKIRPMIQQLGDAINESLADSRCITDAINRIRDAGYDVFLVLEATVGFNKREDVDQRPASIEPKPLVKDGQVDPGLLADKKDEKFLRAMKIKID